MKPSAADGRAQLKRKKMGGKKRKMGMGEKKMRRTGPRLPSALRKELDASKGGSEDRSGSDGEERGDMYEYEEGLAEEETGKNRRFDPVENLEYELPDDFKDEDLPSDEEGGSDADGSDRSEGGEENDDRHLRMLQGITGMPGQVFQDKRKKGTVFSDVHVAEGGATDISIQDLLDPLHGMPGYSSLRKKLNQLEKKSSAVQAPLPKVVRQKLERKVAYEHSKKDMTQWEPLIKRNREAPTIYFEEDTDIGFSTVGAIASEFQPRTEFEKKMASLVGNPEILDAHQRDGSRLLDLNKISVEDVKERQNRLAKMQSLLFRHEMKAKRVKKIKSKTYHRMMKKDRLKTKSAEMEMDPEAIREQSMKQEFKRAEERMTLKHKNSSKWAKRIMKRGLDAQDDGTRAAITEQLQQHALLSRKMNSMKDTSSSEDDDELPDEAVSGGASKLLTKAKEKTFKVIEEEDEMPKSGVLSLPFMVRGLKKKNKALLEEGRIAIQEYDSSLKQLDNGNKTSTSEICASGGRRVFGSTRKEPLGNIDKVESDAIGNSSDSETEFYIEKSAPAGDIESSLSPGAQLDTGLSKKAVVENKNAFENSDDANRETGPKTTYDVAIFVSDLFKKIDTKNKVEDSRRNSVTAPEDLSSSHPDMVAVHDSDMESDEEMVDGFMSSGAKLKYELPSQADVIRSAFSALPAGKVLESPDHVAVDEVLPQSIIEDAPSHGISWPPGTQPSLFPYTESIGGMIMNALRSGIDVEPILTFEEAQTLMQAGTTRYFDMGLPKDPWLKFIDQLWMEFLDIHNKKAWEAEQIKIDGLKASISALETELQEHRLRGEGLIQERAASRAKHAADIVRMDFIKESIESLVKNMEILQRRMNADYEKMQHQDAKITGIDEKISGIVAIIASQSAEIANRERNRPRDL